MRAIALYNREGKRLLTLKQAENRGYGSSERLKKRIQRQQLPAGKLGPLWLVLELSLHKGHPRRRRSSH